MKSRPLHELKNIGKTVAARLHEIGITSEDELKKLGSAQAYNGIIVNTPRSTFNGSFIDWCYLSTKQFVDEFLPKG